mgnify:CR=1 FL=1
MEPPTQTNAPSEGDARSRLLAAAGPVFAAHGFDRATVREICGAANVNVASVGYYFGDKLGLYREVIEAIRVDRERQYPIPTQVEVDARLMLYRLVKTMLSRMLAADSSGWESRLLMREMQQPTPVFESLVKGSFRPMYCTLTDTIRSLVGDSVPRSTVDQLALSVVGQCVYYRCAASVIPILISEVDREADYDIESLARHVTAVTLAATEDRALSRQKAEIESLLTSHTSNFTDEIALDGRGA